jgi:type II secretion system protein D
VAEVYRIIEQIQKLAQAADVKIFTLKRADAATTLPVIQQLLPQSTVILDLRTNSLVVAGARPDVQLAENVLLRLDSAESRDRVTRVYQLKNVQSTTLVTALTALLTDEQTLATRGLAAFPGEQAWVVEDEPGTNSILISATPQYLPEILRLVEEIDQQPAQVIIQVLIADITLTANEEFGVELGVQTPVLFDRSVIPQTGFFGPTGNVTYTPTTTGGVGFMPPGVTVNTSVNPAASNDGNGFLFNNSNPLGNNVVVKPAQVGVQSLTSFGVGRTSSTGGPGGFTFSASSDAISVLVRALKAQGKVEILSRPSVTALDNQVAYIQVGQSVPTPSATTIGASGIATTSVTYVATGVILQVTPKIASDGTIIMRLDPQISTVTNSTIMVGPSTFAPTFDVTRASTTVSAVDGQTVVIGGLIERDETKNETKAPFLGDLPVIGALFRYRTQVKTKHELLILLTPQIIRTPYDPSSPRILAEEMTKMDWQLRDVHKLHRPIEVEPLLPVYPKAPAIPLLPHGDPPPDLPEPFTPDPGDVLPAPRPVGPVLPDGAGVEKPPTLPPPGGDAPPRAQPVSLPKG